MLKVRSHCSRLLENRLPPPPMPALLNRRWILSVDCCSLISSRNRLSWSSIETSATWVVTRRPCGRRSTSHSALVSAIASAETSHIATLQPSATSWRASSRPIPVPPPVMTAIFPAKSFMEAGLSVHGYQPSMLSDASLDKRSSRLKACRNGQSESRPEKRNGPRRGDVQDAKGYCRFRQALCRNPHSARQEDSWLAEI